MAAEVAPLPRLFVSIPEAALVLGISKAYAYRLVATGEIPVKTFGRRKLVPVAALERIAADTAEVPA